jgi:hypothetical protein
MDTPGTTQSSVVVAQAIVKSAGSIPRGQQRRAHGRWIKAQCEQRVIITTSHAPAAAIQVIR